MDEGAIVHIRVLGTLEIHSWRTRIPSPSIRRHHVRGLLGLVSGASTELHRDQLIDALWPDLTYQSAINRLHHTLHLSRKMLSEVSWDHDWIGSSEQRIHLDSAVTTDAHQLSAVAENPGQFPDAVLFRVVAAYQGDWVPGTSLGPLGDQIRADLRGKMQVVLTALCERAVAYGDAPVRRRLLEQLLAFDPSNERAYRELMRLDLELGRNQSVLKTWDKACRELPERLGLRPSAETRELAAQAQTGVSDLEAALMRPHVPALPMIGRLTELRRLEEFACGALLVTGDRPSGPERHCLNLTGPSGIGKTTLVRKFARRMRIAGRRVAYLSLPSLGGEKGSRSSAAFGSWLQFECSRSELIILDDIDVGEDLTSSVCAAITHGKGEQRNSIRFLLVSLQPLNPAEIPVMKVEPLPTPDPTSPMNVLPGTEVFSVHRPMPLSAGQPRESRADLQALVVHFGGYPLALRLAAHRADIRTSGDMLKLPAELFNPGPVECAGLPSRHHSLRSAFSVTLRRLRPASQELFRLIAVLPLEFTKNDLGLLAVKCDFPDWETGLKNLLDAGLVSEFEDPASSTPQLRVDNVVRQYAILLVRQEGGFSNLSRQQSLQLERHLPTGWVNPLAREFTKGRGTAEKIAKLAEPMLDCIRQTQTQLFVRIIVYLTPYWAIYDPPALATNWIDDALTLADKLTDRLSENRLRLGGALLALRQQDEARLASLIHPLFELGSGGIEASDLPFARMVLANGAAALVQSDRAQAWLTDICAGSALEPHHAQLGELAELNHLVVQAGNASLDAERRLVAADKVIKLVGPDMPVWQFAIRARLMRAENLLALNSDIRGFRAAVVEVFQFAMKTRIASGMAQVGIFAAQWSCRLPSMGDPNFWIRNVRELSTEALLPHTLLSIRLTEGLRHALERDSESALNVLTGLPDDFERSADNFQLALLLEITGLLLVVTEQKDILEEMVAALAIIDRRFLDIPLATRYLEQRLVPLNHAAIQAFAQRGSDRAAITDILLTAYNMVQSTE